MDGQALTTTTAQEYGLDSFKEYEAGDACAQISVEAGLPLPSQQSTVAGASRHRVA